MFRNEIGDEGAFAFSRSKPFVNLKSFYIGENNLTDKGAIALIKSNSFPNLETLDMVKNHLSEETTITAFEYRKKKKIQIIFR